MNMVYTWLFMTLSVISLYSADKDIQQLSDIKTCPHIIVHEGTAAVHTDIYIKLLGISRTLQDQINDFGKPTPLTNEPYYPVNRNIESLQYIVNYISADNSNTYLSNLSLLELVHLYQEADFWAVDARTLDTIRNSIIFRLCNKNVLSQLLSSKENLSHFISACNPVTLDMLTQALHSYTSNMLWYTTQTLTGHTKQVKTIAVHTDDTLFSGSYDDTIRVWKKNTQGIYHCVQTLTGHSDSIETVAVHTDGTLFSCSGDCTIRVWKPNAQGTYHCVQTLTGHTTWINTVAVHADGTLFSGSGDGTIYVWKPDAQSIYHRVQTLIGHSEYIKTVAVHADGTLFSASIDYIVRVWKADAQAIYHCVQTLASHKSSVTTVAVHTDGTLFSGSYNAIHVRKIDVQGKYDFMQELNGHNDYISTVTVNTDGTLFSGSRDATIHVWKKLEEHLSLEQHLLLHWLYNTYQSNGKTQLRTLPAHQFQIYHTLPQSIKNHIVTWYKPGYIKYLFSKPYVWASGGLIAGCTALGAYLYYKWFKK